MTDKNNTAVVTQSASIDDDAIHDIPISPSSEQVDAKDVNEAIGTTATATPTPTQDDEDVDALLHSLSTPVDGGQSDLKPNARDEALEKLKQSSMSLGTALSSVSADVNSRFHISEKAEVVGSSVRHADEKLHVSQTVMGAAGSIGSWWSSNVGPALGAAASQVKERVGPAVESSGVNSGVGNAFQNIGNSIQTFDDEHKVSATAMSTLASGVDWVAKSITPVGKENADLDELTADAAQSEIAMEKDKDEKSFPSSFEKK